MSATADHINRRLGGLTSPEYIFLGRLQMAEMMRAGELERGHTVSTVLYRNIPVIAVMDADFLYVTGESI